MLFHTKYILFGDYDKHDHMVNNVTGEMSESGWFLRLRQPSSISA